MHKRVPEQALEFNRTFIRDMLGAAPTNAQHLALAREALTKILREELTPRQQQILMMFYYERKNRTRIAEELGVNKSTVGRTMERAQQRIRKSLQFYFDYVNFRLTE